MGSTLRVARGNGKGRGRAPHRITAELASRLGKSDRWAMRQLYEVPTVRTVALTALEVMRDLEDHQALARFSAPFRAFFAGIQPARLSVTLMLSAQQADSAEEVVEAAFHLNPTPQTAEALVRAIDREMLAQSALRDALVREYGL